MCPPPQHLGAPKSPVGIGLRGKKNKNIGENPAERGRTLFSLPKSETFIF